MILSRRQGGFRCLRKRAFSLAEVLVSVALVSGLLVAALDLLGATTIGRQRMADRSRAQLLALDLMSEIMRQAYEDPEGPVVFGRESTESGGNRLDFDDVDDFDTWFGKPPEARDGTKMMDLQQWGRTVAVEWVDQSDLTTASGPPTDIKRITITVDRSGTTLAELVAVRSLGLPPPQPSPTILLVAGVEQNLTVQESARVALLESWGYTVDLIDASDNQANFTQALAAADVAYVSMEVLEAELGIKLGDAPVGVVNEAPALTIGFGFYSSYSNAVEPEILIVDNSHYITSPFSTGLLVLFSSSQTVNVMSGIVAGGLQVLGQTHTSGPNYKDSFAVIDKGGLLYGGGGAAERRVQLPWGRDTFDINSLGADGQTLMQRAVDWAANREQP